LRQYADSVAAASWDSVIFDIPGRESLQRVPTLEPLRGTKAHVGQLLDRCKTAGDLVAALTGQLSPRGTTRVPDVGAPGPDRKTATLSGPSAPTKISRVRLAGHPAVQYL
jgi:hypothetical protein